MPLQGYKSITVKKDVYDKIESIRRVKNKPTLAATITTIIEEEAKNE